ncbi:hypothetical protein KR009_004614, partial [Drosophila setifemur]
QRELRHQEQLAWSLVRQHSFATTNSHEVKRQLAGLVERFRVENMTSFGEAVKDLSEKLLAQPETETRSQTEQDVLWSLLDLVLAMTNEPVQNIRRNRLDMDRRREQVVQEVETALQPVVEVVVPNPAEVGVDWVALLSEDFLEPPSPPESLSDWTDSDESSIASSQRPEPLVNTSLELADMADVYERALEEAGRDVLTIDRNIYLPLSPPNSSRSAFHITQPKVLALSGRRRDRLGRSRLPKLAPLQPPSLASQVVRSTWDGERLPRLIHDHWWRGDVHVLTIPTDPRPLANFAVSYAQFLGRNVPALRDYPLPKTLSESCLLREILFMFASPASCCFFELDELTGLIKMRDNVTICSVTVGALRHVIKKELLHALEDMRDLRGIIKKHTMFTGTTGTLECFAYGLRDMVQPIALKLLEYEAFVDKEPTKATLIHFVHSFRKQFEQLHLLRHLAKDVILRIGPPHLRSAFLLSQLYKHTQVHVPHQKLATSLLLVSLRRYCSIIDAWWRRASLEDSQNEFIVERRWVVDAKLDASVRRRNLDLDNSSSQNADIFVKVQNCPFYRMLLEHALDSGDSQVLLANVKVLGEMLSASNEIQPRSLYEELSDQLFDQLSTYCPDVARGSSTEVDTEHEQGPAKLALAAARGLSNADIRALFVGRVEERAAERRLRRLLVVPQILERLEAATCLQIRVELPNALRQILQRRQALANVYAVRAYCVDLEVGKHLQFLRHNLLLEAYYLLLPYYQSLFRRVEAGEGWANASQLTTELGNVLESHYPRFARDLHLRVTSRLASGSTKVYEALDGLELAYSMSDSLQGMIRSRHMRVYNAVWRLMLKIKWACWKLENLPFIRRSKRDAYAPLDLLGLTVRRLEILRFWLIYLISSLHTHIMQCLGQRIEAGLGKCRNIRELKAHHDEYTSWLKTFCLLADDFSDFRSSLEQLFHLVFVLDIEWSSCSSYLNDGDALSLDVSLSDDAAAGAGAGAVRESEGGGRSLEYLALNQVVEIEMTYILCHQKLAEILNSLVYKQGYDFRESL